VVLLDPDTQEFRGGHFAKTEFNPAVRLNIYTISTPAALQFASFRGATAASKHDNLVRGFHDARGCRKTQFGIENSREEGASCSCNPLRSVSTIVARILPIPVTTLPRLAEAAALQREILPTVSVAFF